MGSLGQGFDAGVVVVAVHYSVAGFAGHDALGPGAVFGEERIFVLIGFAAGAPDPACEAHTPIGVEEAEEEDIEGAV